jgi:hypothetical protein
MHPLERFLVGSELEMRYREVTLGSDHSFLVAEPSAAKQYLCELYGSNGDRPVTTVMPSDNGPPEVAEVVDAVAAEAAVIEETSCYEAWAERMGFDLDSRRGARVYRTERRQAWLLRALLGREAYRKLLWETERL